MGVLRKILKRARSATNSAEREEEAPLMHAPENVKRKRIDPDRTPRFVLNSADGKINWDVKKSESKPPTPPPGFERTSPPFTPHLLASPPAESETVTLLKKVIAGLESDKASLQSRVEGLEGELKQMRVSLDRLTATLVAKGQSDPSPSRPPPNQVAAHGREREHDQRGDPPVREPMEVEQGGWKKVARGRRPREPRPAPVASTARDEKTRNLVIIEEAIKGQFQIEDPQVLTNAVASSKKGKVLGKPTGGIIINDHGAYAAFKELECECENGGPSKQGYYTKLRVKGDGLFVYDQIRPALNPSPPPGPLACDMKREGGYGHMYQKGVKYVALHNLRFQLPQKESQITLDLRSIYRELKREMPSEYIGS